MPRKFLLRTPCSPSEVMGAEAVVVEEAEFLWVVEEVRLTREAEFVSPRSVGNQRSTVRLPSVVPAWGCNPVRRDPHLSALILP